MTAILEPKRLVNSGNEVDPQVFDQAAALGLTLLEQFGTRMPKTAATTCLACGTCDTDKDGRDGIFSALYDSVDSLDVTSVKLDEVCDEDFQAAPLRITFRKMIGREEADVICYLKTCEWRLARVRLGYEVEVSV